MEASCLSMHAGYRCRNTGLCCHMGWPIHVAPTAVQRYSAHFRDTRGPLFSYGDRPDDAILRTRPGGACVLYEQNDAGACTVHRELGESQLPSACRHFPRVVLRDGRGMHVTLSHFCPTAAACLFDDGPLRIVTAPPSLTLHGMAEGLDATHVLPPLLRPGVLMDLDGLAAWEQEAVAVLSDDTLDAPRALARVTSATRRMTAWSPGAERLDACVRRAFGDAAAHRAPGDRHVAGGVVDPDADLHDVARAASAVPAGVDAPPILDDHAVRWPQARRIWEEFDAVVRRYLAAKIFASWYTYDGSGPATTVRLAHMAAAVLRVELSRRVAGGGNSRDIMVESLRAADLLLVHVVDHRALARRSDHRALVRALDDD